MSARKILVVDDDPDILEIVQSNLVGAGYQVIGAADGVEAIEKVRLESPDLVVLEMFLPELDGCQVLRRIQADPETAGLPVIMLSCGSQDEDVLEGLREGAVEYICKPFYPDNLVASVKILLEVFDRRMRQDRRWHLIASRQRLAGLDREPAPFTRDPACSAFDGILGP